MRSYSRSRKRGRNPCVVYSLPSPSPPPSPSPSPSSPPLRTPVITSGDEETHNEKRLGTLLDLELLNCPVCAEPFTHFIFQCDNGHLACSLCCTKLRNKCPNCTLPIGNIRCRAMENMVESVTVPCRNSSFGCTEIFSYKDEKTHEKECLFCPCSCPLIDCDYKGHYKDLYQHFDSTHKSASDRYSSSYVCDTTVDVWMRIEDKIYVLKETKECLLFVVQCFSDENGSYVNVSCVAPLGVELGKFSYHLSRSCRYTITYDSPEINRIQEVEFERPEENFMSIPRFFNGHLKMKLLIRKQNPK